MFSQSSVKGGEGMEVSSENNEENEKALFDHSS